MAASTESILERIDPERRVSEGVVSLTAGDRNVRATVPLEAVRHSGRDVDDPGSSGWFYLRDRKLLILDLGGEFEA